MSEELYFDNELRKCLNAAGLSDCGENDAWNYWYQRVHKAHDQAVDRVTEAQLVNNVKLRERIAELEELLPDSGRWFSADTVEAYVAENAKLRELVSGLEYCVQGHVCDCCPLYDPSGTNHRRCESLERELGIEADE